MFPYIFLNIKLFGPPSEMLKGLCGSHQFWYLDWYEVMYAADHGIIFLNFFNNILNHISENPEITHTNYLHT